MNIINIYLYATFNCHVLSASIIQGDLCKCEESYFSIDNFKSRRYEKSYYWKRSRIS